MKGEVHLRPVLSLSVFCHSKSVFSSERNFMFVEYFLGVILFGKKKVMSKSGIKLWLSDKEIEFLGVTEKLLGYDRFLLNASLDLRDSAALEAK